MVATPAERDVFMGADTAFISYSHDSPEHSDRVLAFANKLRSLGVDVEIDQYHSRPEEGWPQWCEVQLRPENSKFVLLICTRAYRDRVENKIPADEGRGVYWEGGIINQYIYNAKAGGRFIPVLLGDESSESVPIRLQGLTEFRIKTFDLGDSGFEALYRELTGQPAVVKPTLGAKVPLGERTLSAPQVAAPLPEKPALSIFPASPPPLDVRRDAGNRWAIIVGGLAVCAAVAGLSIWVFRPPPPAPPQPIALGPTASLSEPGPAAGPHPGDKTASSGQTTVPDPTIWTPLQTGMNLVNLSASDVEVFGSPNVHSSVVGTIQPGTSFFLEGAPAQIQRATIDGEVWLRVETGSGPAFVLAKSLCQPGTGPCDSDSLPTSAK
jgi:hypothetical protein